MKYLKIVSVIAMLMVLVACGGSSNRDELAAAGTPAVLYSSAPSALTVVAAAPASPFSIGGGTPPYSASSSNASVATATVSGSSLNIAGGLVGNATVLILDSKGARVEIALTVSAPQAAPTLRTTAPSDITLAAGATNSFSIFGGTPPYLTSSSNASVVTSGVNGNSISVIGVARGTGNILVLDATGAQVAITVTVGSTTVTPLFTSASSAVALTVGAADVTYTIGGGVPPYSASSSNLGVATASVSGTSLSLKGLTTGSATAVVLDSTGSKIDITLTVGSGTPVTAFRTTAPSAITLGVGSTDAFTMSGGTPPYVASTSNSGVATVSVNGGSLSIAGKATGSANILALDATGAQVAIAVTVGSTNITPLFTSASSAVTLTAGAPDVVYTIGGGVPPYSASSSNLGVATASVSGTSLSLKGLTTGSATAVVLDSTGSKIDVTLTVGSSTPVTTFRTTAPSAITLGTDSTDVFTMSGGTPPYVASTSNSGVATVSVNGGSLSIAGKATGSANILALDATGAQVAIAVTVGSTNVTPLFTSASSAVALTVGAADVTYTIGGGVPPYSASSSNLGVATASVSGTSLSLKGLTTGSATAVVLDSTGSKIDITLTVGSGTPVTAFRTTAPSAITLGVGSMDAFTMSGGTPPYVASTSNSGVATVSVNGGSLSIAGKATGSANILALDATGAQVAIAVTVGSTNITPLFTSASSAVSLTAGAPDVVYTIGGGVPPYSASSSNLGVATASVSGTSLSLKGLSSGSGSVVVLDSTGTRVEITLTVGSSTAVTALRTTAPSAITLGVGTTNTFTISGGVPPYISSPSNTGVATTTVTGTTLNITGVATGVAQVLALDSTGTQVVISVTVGSTTATPLFTTAGATVGLAVGAVESTYSVGGGTPPYAVGSSNINVASASLTGSNLYLKGLSAGSSTIILLDSTGAKIEISATVSSNTTPAGTFFTTAPSSITLAAGQIRSFAISGGLSPYATSSSNAAVVNANVSGATLTVTGSVTGNATVVVFDSTGAQIPVTVTVGSTGTVSALYTTSPSAVTMGVSGTGTYTVDGGSPPYRVSSSNTNLATAGINGSTLTVIAGATAGTAQILVFDSTGTQVVIALTVGSATAPGLYTTAPSAITLASGGAAVGYKVGGGVPPYATSSGNAAVATATLTGVDLTITPGASGSGTIVVLDSTGTKVEIAVTVPTVVGATINVLPNSASGNAGDSLTFTITGGSGTYTATSNNLSIATTSLSSSTITATLLNVGQTSITVRDSTGLIAAIPLTVAAAASQIRLSPSAFVVGENSVDPVKLYIYGGTPPYTAITSNSLLSSVLNFSSLVVVAQAAPLPAFALSSVVAISPSPYVLTTSRPLVFAETTGVISYGTRCINAFSSDTPPVYVEPGVHDVTFTVIDSLGASASSIMTIKDNRAGSPGAPNSGCP